MSKRIVMEWKRMPNSAGTFLGFATVTYGSLLIRDCPVNRTAGRVWVGLPGKVQVGKDGQALRDERGKMKYVAFLEWPDRATSDKWSESVIADIIAQFGEEALALAAA
jgi:hypothetical protein